MRYYLINNKGEILAENSNKYTLQLHMQDIFTVEEIEKDEIEIIEGN